MRTGLRIWWVSVDENTFPFTDYEVTDLKTAGVAVGDIAKKANAGVRYIPFFYANDECVGMIDMEKVRNITTYAEGEKGK